jgi:hypothetical protein
LTSTKFIENRQKLKHAKVKRDLEGRLKKPPMKYEEEAKT